MKARKYIIKLERSPQHDFIERVGFGFDREDVIKRLMDSFFEQNPAQKVRLAGCIEIID